MSTADATTEPGTPQDAAEIEIGLQEARRLAVLRIIFLMPA
jgi:hypothetical protein